MMTRWKLGFKFSLWLGLVWIVGVALTTVIFAQQLNLQAEQAVRERASLLLTTMQASRNYTRDNIQPLLESQIDTQETFIRESIPNFAAKSIFSEFKQQDPDFQDFAYKEAALNPTNIADLADDFEQVILSKLQKQKFVMPEMLTGYRTIGTQKLFFLARPIVMTDKSCLKCHGRPSDAPKMLLQDYGDQMGFGWKLNDVVATQMVYVPANKVFAQGRQNLLSIMKTFLGFLFILFLVINLLLWRMVINPLKILTLVAKHISSKTMQTVPAIESDNQRFLNLTSRQDEPGQLARAFEYMLQVLGQREQDLQQAVQERTQDLEQEMRDRKTTQDALQTYAHAINHDLRNMVMGISILVQGITYQFSKKPKSLTSSTQSQTIEVEEATLSMIQMSCDRQLDLINSLMDVQSPDMWEISLKPEPVRLHQLIDNLKLGYKAKLREAKSRLTTVDLVNLPEIYVDKMQVQRVFENLLENSLKYNDDSITVQISATLTSNDPGMLHCLVTDTGIGIDAANSQNLFSIYSRGDREVTGYGLGLYICRKIVEAHGGKIGLNPEKKIGAEFWFTLPLNR